MKTITDCPRCGNDFMYDYTDTYLIRTNIPLNTGTLGLNEEDLKEHDYEYFICQDCDHVETLCQGVVQSYRFHDYEGYKNCVKDEWEDGHISELKEIGFIVELPPEKQENGFTKIASRYLTEKEFIARFGNQLNENNYKNR